MSEQAKDILRPYFDQPESYWEGVGWRQAAKLRGAIESAANSIGSDRGTIGEVVLAEARLRSPDRPPPVYVVSIGGAGSHWVGGMIGELPGLVTAAEVYVPPPILEQLADLPLSVQGEVVDAIHLVHAWGLTKDWEQVKVSAVVNTAHRPQMIGVFRAWDPETTVIHLVRDPRDRALSVTYRKELYRSQSSPDLDDESCLRRNAKRSDVYLRRYRRAEHQADLELRYEEIKVDPGRAIQTVCKQLGLDVSNETVNQAVFLHDADHIRSGVVASKGNLDEGGRSQGWRSASRRDRMLMHHILAWPVDSLGYRDDDCLARDQPERISRPARTIDPAASGLPIRLDISRAGSPWEHLEGTQLPPDTTLRVRPREPIEPAVLRHALDQLQPDVLCLAGLQGLQSIDLSFLAGIELIGIDIAGTALGEDFREVLDSMKVQWISATDTPLEELGRTERGTLNPDQQSGSTPTELHEARNRARSDMDTAGAFADSRRLLRRREREIDRLRYRLEVSNWKLSSMRQRRWWRIGTALGEVRRRPLSVFTLPVRLLRTVTFKAPRLPRPVPPPEFVTTTARNSEGSGEMGVDPPGPIHPRHEHAALGLLGRELAQQLAHEVQLFELDHDYWRDQFTVMAPTTFIVESGVPEIQPSPLTEVLDHATTKGVRTVLWDTEPRALPNTLKARFDAIVGDGKPPTDDFTGQLIERRGLVQPRIHNPIGGVRARRSADVDLANRAINDKKSESLSDLAAHAKGYEVLRSRKPGELLELAAIAATATPVVATRDSTPLGVPVESEEEAEIVERSLINSEVLRARLGHPRMRHVFREFSISSDVNQLLNGSSQEWPMIDIMVPTNRPQNLTNILANLGRQTYPNFRVFIIAHGLDLDQAALEEQGQEAGVRLAAAIHVPEEVILGEVFNIGFGETEASIVAKIDDDDFYGPEYLWDLYSALDFSGAEVAGKWAHYAYLEGPDYTVYRYPSYEHRFTDVVAISTLLMHRDVLEAERFPPMPWGSGSKFLRALGAQGARVFAADRWNYLYVRGQEGERNTFPISDLRLLSISNVICRGINTEEVIV